MKSVGFKEWAVVCEALGSGRQSILLRKGGIAEGSFSFKHRDFFLFPTWFHEQPQKVREMSVNMPQQPDETVEIKYAATLEIAEAITSWEVAEALAPFHILQRDVVRERFDYDRSDKDEAEPHQGLHVAFVRVFRLQPKWSFPNDKRYGGCRSWVKLSDLPNQIRLEPVLTENQHNKRREEYCRLVGPSL